MCKGFEGGKQPGQAARKMKEETQVLRVESNLPPEANEKHNTEQKKNTWVYLKLAVNLFSQKKKQKNTQKGDLICKNKWMCQLNLPSGTKSIHKPKT